MIEFLYNGVVIDVSLYFQVMGVGGMLLQANLEDAAVYADLQVRARCKSVLRSHACITS